MNKSLQKQKLSLTNHEKPYSVAIIGATSGIAQGLLKAMPANVARLLLTSRRTVFDQQAFDQQAFDQQAIADSLRASSISHLQHAYLSLDDAASWQCIDWTAVDVAFVLPAITSIAACEQHPEFARQINVLQTQHLLTHLAEQDVFSVFMSTNQVFSCAHEFIAWDSPYEPFSYYGELKAEVEQFITQQQLSCAVVRPGKVIPSQWPLIETWKQQLHMGERVEAFTDHRIAPIRLYTLNRLLWLIANVQKPGVYQLSGDQDLSYFDLLRQIIKLFGFSADNIAECRAITRGVTPTPFGSLAPFFADLPTNMVLDALKPTDSFDRWHRGEPLAALLHSFQV